jgi:hypothetical protein
VTWYVDGGTQNHGINDLHAVTPSVDEGTPISAPEKFDDDDLSVVFSNHERHAVEFIRSYPVIAGCVAWLTNDAVLAALADRLRVGIIVQKEDFLRPDFKPGPGWEKRLRDRYAALPGAPALAWGVPLSYCGPGSAEPHPIRCMGLTDPEAKRKALPRMHHKFLIGCEHADNPNDDFAPPVPRAVWTGSVNLTYNATLSRENAVILRRPRVAAQFMSEFQELLALSEPLDWQSQWVVPEFRYGS